jgi:hypothetical protein
MIFKQLLGISLCLFIMMTTCYADSRALLVGIDEYQHINELIGSKQDVESMNRFIQSEWGYKPWQIRTLTDAEATDKGILTAFDNWLIKGSQPGDKVLFYYSGHGTFITDNARHKDEEDGYDEALCPVNTTRGKENLIRDDEINRRLQQLRGRQVMFIIDACHSGTMTKSAFSSPTVKQPIFNAWKPRQTTKSAFERDTAFVETQQGVVAYTAVAPHQVALVDTTIQPNAGVFTHRFIQGIQNKRADSNGDGKVSHQELLEYTRSHSKTFCKKMPHYFCYKGLTPQLEIKSGMSEEDIRIWAAINNRLPSTTPTFIDLPRFNEDLQIKILPNSPQLDQKLRVWIMSERNGYLLLFDANNTGSAKTLTRLVPSQYGKNVRIKAGKPRMIPDQLSGWEMVAKSPGKRILVALLVNNTYELSILENAFPDAFDKVMSKNAHVPKQLAQQLGQTLQRNNATKNVIWSIATLNYEIRH